MLYMTDSSRQHDPGSKCNIILLPVTTASCRRKTAEKKNQPPHQSNQHSIISRKKKWRVENEITQTPGRGERTWPPGVSFCSCKRSRAASQSSFWVCATRRQTFLFSLSGRSISALEILASTASFVFVYKLNLHAYILSTPGPQPKSACSFISLSFFDECFQTLIFQNHYFANILWSEILYAEHLIYMYILYHLRSIWTLKEVVWVNKEALDTF